VSAVLGGFVAHVLSSPHSGIIDLACREGLFSRFVDREAESLSLAITNTGYDGRNV
jgi:hypothetical protein